MTLEHPFNFFYEDIIRPQRILYHIYNNLMWLIVSGEKKNFSSCESDR